MLSLRLRGLYVRNIKDTGCIEFSRKMSVFIQKLNPITGKNDWIMQNEDYDYHQEIARSAFADMLHDTERNQLYEQGIKVAIQTMHARHKKAKVLDIGTGTGLLAMMAVRNGADSVVACEAFKPMSECAYKIISQNRLIDKITILSKRSTYLTVGETGDLKEKCNILVTEIFDTELIGEGALSTFSHAHKELLEKDCIVVPSEATIYAQIVECPLAQNWNKLKDIYNDKGINIQIPESIKKCSGSAAVHDVQLSQLPLNSFQTISDPLPVLKFDWSGKTPFIYERSTITSLKCKENGTAQVVFMWWDLQMDVDNKIILTCAPWWVHPLKKKAPWRDHWMQGIYYLPQEIQVHKDQEIYLISCHDEFSLWFNLVKNLRITDEHYVNPICECGLHMGFSRTRIGQINDIKRIKKFHSLLENKVNDNSDVLILSEGFYSALLIAKMGARKMYILDENYLSGRILKDFINSNNLCNVEEIPYIEDLKDIDLKNVQLVLGEPYYTSSILPWDNLLNFMYLVEKTKDFLPNNTKFYPQRASIKGVAVHFSDLYKIRTRLENCEGFDMKEFDKLIEESSKISDDIVEAQPLWEYPGTALSKEVEIVNIDLINTIEDLVNSNGLFEIESDQLCNGIALWVEWDLDGRGENIITTGPTSPIEIGEIITWDMYTRQGVYLFPNRKTQSIHFNFMYDLKEGDISFKFK